MAVLIGLDGGGTKTAGMLCDPQGRVLARHQGAPSAIVGMPQPSACAALNDLVDRLCADARVNRTTIAHVALGLSGVDFDDEIPGQHTALCAALNLAADALTLVNDAVTALWGVSANHRLGLIQHGTGVTSAYREAPGAETVFDSLDVASVFDVRRYAFSETARMIDGRVRRTPLADRVLAHCGVSAGSFAEWAYRYPGEARGRRLTCARVVFDAWREGDPAATDLVERAAADYAVTAGAIGNRLGDSLFSVGFGGGVIAQGGSRFLEVLERALATTCSWARLSAIALPPEAGGVVLAAHRTHIDWEGVFTALERQLSPGPIEA